MKLNCDRLWDWLKKQKAERKRIAEQKAKNKQLFEEQWHGHFVIYKRLEHGDCRILERVERRKTEKWKLEAMFSIWPFNGGVLFDTYEEAEKANKHCWDRRIYCLIYPVKVWEYRAKQ